MKTNRLFTLAVGLTLALGTQAQKATVTPLQEKAQKSIMDALRAKGFSPSIDTEDQSVCFNSGGVFYWITIEGKNAPLLYTIHRRSIKFSDDKDQLLARKKEIAEKAANKVSAQTQVKAYLDGNKVDFVFPMYAQTPDDFGKVLYKGIEAFKGVKEKFDQGYMASKASVDSIHRYWNQVDTSCIVIPQPKVAEALVASKITAKGIEARVVDGKDQVVSEYNKSIRKSKCFFLQEKLTLTAEKTGVYKIGVKLYAPNGKLLVPEAGAKYTTTTLVHVAKANKEAAYELNKFGADDSKVWKAGEYKIEFYNEDELIYSDAINIL